MNVISLFDGMSCLQIALEESNIKVDNYYASEIDVHAVKMSTHLYPNTIHLGNITKWAEWDINWSKIDIIGAGSPCQGFSFAGKQLNFNDDRSKLFFVFVDILNHIKKHNPNVKFLLENVNMKREYLGVISDYVGLFPCNINSNLVSAQNRNRWYWTSIKTKKVGLFDEIHSDIPQPKDEGILLKDILQPESEIEEKYYINNPKVDFSVMDINGKNNTLRTGGRQSQKHNFDIIGVVKNESKLRAVEKSSCLDANYYKGIDNHEARTAICVAMQGRNPDNQTEKVGCLKFGRTEEGKRLRKESMKKGIDHTPFQAKQVNSIDFNKMNTITTATTKDNLLMVMPKVTTEQRLEPKTDGKTNCLTSVSKDNLILQVNPSKESGGKQPYQPNRVYSTEGQMPSLCAGVGGRNNIIVKEATSKGFVEIEPNQCVDLENINSKTRRGRKMEDKSNCLMEGKTEFHKFTEDYKLRRLTPRECGRLQTVPEHIIDKMLNSGVSNSQIYKIFGNGWTIKVITHILKQL